MTAAGKQIRMVLMREEDPYHRERFEHCSIETAEKLNIRIDADTVADNKYHPGDLYFYDCCGREDTWKEEIAALEIPRSSLILISGEKDRWRDVMHCGGYDLVRPRYMLEDMCRILDHFLNEHAGSLYLPFHKNFKPIPVAGICSISVLGSQITISTTSGSYTRYESLNSFIIHHDLMQWMVRVSRSVLINPQNVQSVSAECVTMENGEVHYFSRSCSSSARALLYRTHLKTNITDSSK